MSDTIQQQNAESSQQVQPSDVAEQEAKTATPEPTIDPQTAKRLELIAKQERQFREREKAVKARELELSEAKKLLDTFSDDDKIIEYLESKKPDTFKKWANRIIGEERPDPASKALSEVQQLKAHIEKLESERKQQAEAAAWNNFVDTTVKQVQTQEEKYPLVVSEGAEAEVAEYIRLHYDKHQEVLNVDAAAEIVENYLRERYAKALKHGGAQKLLTSMLPTPQVPEKSEQKQGSNAMKTLTTRAVSQATARKSRSDVSHDDAWAEILAKM